MWFISFVYHGYVVGTIPWPWEFSWARTILGPSCAPEMDCVFRYVCKLQNKSCKGAAVHTHSTSVMQKNWFYFKYSPILPLALTIGTSRRLTRVLLLLNLFDYTCIKDETAMNYKTKGHDEKMCWIESSSSNTRLILYGGSASTKSTHFSKASPCSNTFRVWSHESCHCASKAQVHRFYKRFQRRPSLFRIIFGIGLLNIVHSLCFALYSQLLVQCRRCTWLPFWYLQPFVSRWAPVRNYAKRFITVCVPILPRTLRMNDGANWTPGIDWRIWWLRNNNSEDVLIKLVTSRGRWPQKHNTWHRSIWLGKVTKNWW